MNRAKLVLIAVVVLLVLIVILQNTKAVETKILFFTIVMPRIVLLLLSLGVGFMLGVLYRVKKEKKE